MHIFYVYHGEKDKTYHTEQGVLVTSYCMGYGKLNGSRVVNKNNSKRLNDLALESIKEYSDFIFKQNKIFLNNGLQFENKLSLYFLSDLACKRTEQSTTYSNYCNVKLIREFLHNNSVNKIILDGCRKPFIESIVSSELKIPCIILNEVIEKNSLFLASIKNLVFFLKVFAASTIRKVFFRKQDLKELKIYDKLFLTRFPLHLDENLHEEKYAGFVRDNDKFLVNLFTDNFHQKTSIRKYFRSTKFLSSFEKVHILDDYLSPLDALWSLFYSICIIRKFGAIQRQKFILNGIDLTSNIYNEFPLALQRIPRLLMWKNSVKRFVASNHVKSLYYYLHEYGYGRLFTYLFRTYSPTTHLVGFQHGPASKRKMLYMVAEGELSNDGDSIDAFPIPDEVLAEDEFSAEIYRNAGYLNVSVMERIYRLFYLKNANQTNPDPDMVLITPGLHDGEFLLKSIRDLINKDKAKKFILNPHPHADNRYINDFLQHKNLQLTDSSLTFLLSKSSKVIATYSSLAIEARLLGIEVELVEIAGRINESPLLDAGFIDCVDKIRGDLKIYLPQKNVNPNI